MKISIIGKVNRKDITPIKTEDHRNLEGCLGVMKESLKNSESVETEFQLMTSAIPVHCSTN